MSLRLLILLLLSVAFATTATATAFSLVAGPTNITLCDGGRTVCGINGNNFFQPGFESTNSNNSLFTVTLTKHKDFADFSRNSVVTVASIDCEDFLATSSLLQCNSLHVPSEDAGVSNAINVSIGVALVNDEVRFGPIKITNNATTVVSVSLPAGLSVVGDCPPSPSPPSMNDGQDESDSLIFPASSGVVLPKPALWRGVSETGWIYPGKAALQFVARRCGDSALYIQTLDTDGHVKDFGFEAPKTPSGSSISNLSSVLLSISHNVDTTTTAATTMTTIIPYVTSFSVLASNVTSWQSVAERYRKWALAPGTFPAAKKLAERDDVPAMFRGGGGGGVAGSIFGIQTDKGFNPNALGPNLALLPPAVQRLQRATNVSNFVAVVYGWENNGTWAGIDYFPAQPNDAAWRNVSAAFSPSSSSHSSYSTSQHVALLVSGWWWVLKRQQTNSGPAFNNEAQLFSSPENMAMLIKNSTRGTPFEENQYNVPTGRQSWRGLSVQLCHGSSIAQRKMSDIFYNVTRTLGVTMISFDQDIGGGQQKPCFDPSHGHPPGLGAWAWQGFRRTLQTIKQRAQPLLEKGQSLVLLSEQCSELASMDVSTGYSSCWSREFAPTNFPFGRARVKGIFSFIYHEYNAALAAAEVQGVQESIIFTVVKAYANSVARGLPLVPFDFALQKNKMLWRAYFNYNAHGFAKYGNYLVGGKTLSLPGGDAFVDCSGAIVTIPQQHRNETFCAASVGRFAPAGGGGGLPMTFVANAADKEITIVVGGRSVQVPALDVVVVQM